MRIGDLQKCIDKQNANNSQAREVIFRILLNTEDCLDVSRLLDEVQDIYPKKISVNTIYRHLNFFVECGLAVALQNENRKAYYCLLDETLNVFTMCPKCGLIQKVKENDKSLDLSDTKLTEAEYITIHKKCERCI